MGRGGGNGVAGEGRGKPSVRFISLTDMNRFSLFVFPFNNLYSFLIMCCVCF